LRECSRNLYGDSQLDLHCIRLRESCAICVDDARLCRIDFSWLPDHVAASTMRDENIARHVVNNARPLLIALPRYGNMPGNEDAAALSRGTVREEP
jgi:hypothetical protein